MSEFCTYCGSPRERENLHPWRCHRCNALVPWCPEPPPGDPIMFGPYMLVRRIAAGGMGVVYEARRKTVKDFEKVFAIKRLLPSLTHDQDFISMLVEEAKICVKLEHPNIVQVFELDKIDSEYYLAMEYVPGGNFANMLRFSAATRRLLPVPVVAHFASEALKGLAYAHGVGRGGGEETFTHRDVSPQNIMVGRDGRVKLTDFGIAKAMASSTASRVGTIKGKLAYMAPESLTGGRASPCIDVFAMGVVIHEALASRRLFRAATEAALVATVLRGQVPPLNRYRNDVPRGLERVIRTALAVNPSLRYQDGGALRDDLVKALPPGMLEEGMRQAGPYVEEYFKCVGLPGEPLDPVADAPVGVRGATAQAMKAFSHSISDSFPTVPTGGERRSLRLWIAFAVATGLCGLVGAAAAVYFALIEPRLQGQPDAGPRVVFADDGGSADAEPIAHRDLDAALAAADRSSQAADNRPRKLTVGDIERAIMRNMAGLNSCAARYRSAVPKSGVRFSLVIRRDGRVTDAVIAPASLRGTGLDTCLADVVAKLRFPRHSEPEVRVTVPLKFQIE
ncbi:MAG: serine/threonine protein kinase [Deltaproteobacteria bacterium]|nr:serine/threonine protein kinase [Deltaproteobacteria bacterium]